MKILITGANGFVGSHLCERLLKDGHEVFALVRNPSKFTELTDERLKIIKGSLDDSNLTWVESLPLDLDSCIHTAGIVHSYLPDEFYRVNALGTENLATSLKKRFTDLHFILISSLAAAGPSLDHQKRNEDDMDFPVSVYGHSKKAAEIALNKNAPSSWKITIIRPPMVIGPKDAAVLDIFKMVKSRLILLPGHNSRKKVYSYVCVFDLVETITQTLLQKKTGVFYSANPEAITFDDLIIEIKKQLNQKWIIYFPMPLFIVRLLATLLNFFFRVFPHQLRLTPDKIHELAAINWTCDSKKSEAELGQQYNFDLERTVTITLLDYKTRKWL